MVQSGRRIFVGGPHSGTSDSQWSETPVAQDFSLSQYRYRPQLEFVSQKFSYFAGPACIGRG
jgi:hypothetical protein